MPGRRIGARRHVIEIQQQSETVDDLGVAVQTWTTIKRWRCEIETPRASEIYRNDRPLPLEVHIFKGAFIRGVQTDMRVKYGDEHYEIDNVLNPAVRNRDTHIVARRLNQKTQIGRL